MHRAEAGQRAGTAGPALRPGVCKGRVEEGEAMGEVQPV